MALISVSGSALRTSHYDENHLAAWPSLGAGRTARMICCAPSMRYWRAASNPVPDLSAVTMIVCPVSVVLSRKGTTDDCMKGIADSSGREVVAVSIK